MLKKMRAYIANLPYDGERKVSAKAEIDQLFVLIQSHRRHLQSIRECPDQYNEILQVHRATRVLERRYASLLIELQALASACKRKRPGHVESVLVDWYADPVGVGPVVPTLPKSVANPIAFAAGLRFE